MRMATYASRPAWELRARSVSNARVVAPLGIGALLAVSVALRTTELGAGFWIDEGLSVGIADRPLGDIPGVLRQDGSPPLYYMLLHVWLGLAGHSEESVRWLSVLFATLCVPVAFWAGWSLFGRRTAWIAALVVAVNPFLTRYAQEGRMYALVILLGLLSVTCWCLAFTTVSDTLRRGPAIAFAVALAAMLYTHNWSIFFGAATGIAWLWLVWRARADERRRLLAHRRDRVRRRAGAVRAVDPEHALPGGSHGSAVVEGAVARGARVGAGADTGGGRRAGRLPGRRRGHRGAAAPARRAWPRDRRVAADRRAHDRARLDRLAALARLGEPLSLRGRRAVPAAHGRRLRLRRPARARRARAHLRAVGAHRCTGAEEQRARCRRGDRSLAAARRPGGGDAARAGPRARLLPARRPALRDADRAGRRQGRGRLA